MSTVSVRYIVNDVDAAIAFYVDHLAFAELIHPDPAFAMLTRGDLRLVLVSPVPAGHRGGGSRPMPDGTRQQPGGWNRFMIEVADLAGTVDRLNAAGAHFRNEIVTGIGTRQILLEDPSGNVVELFEPVRPEARLTTSPAAAASPHPVDAVGWLASFRRGSPGTPGLASRRRRPFGRRGAVAVAKVGRGRGGQSLGQSWRTILPGMPPAAFALSASAACASVYTAPTWGRKCPSSTRRASSIS